MSTYRIPYTKDVRDDVVNIAKSFSNDILIETVEDEGVTITIESDKAEDIYNSLLEEIGRKIYAIR